MYTAEQKHYAHTVSNAVCHLCDVKKKKMFTTPDTDAGKV